MREKLHHATMDETLFEDNSNTNAIMAAKPLLKKVAMLLPSDRTRLGRSSLMEAQGMGPPKREARDEQNNAEDGHVLDTRRTFWGGQREVTYIIVDAEVGAHHEASDNYANTASYEQLLLSNVVDKENRDKCSHHLHHAHCKEGNQVSIVDFIASLSEDHRGIEDGCNVPAELLEEHQEDDKDERMEHRWTF